MPRRWIGVVGAALLFVATSSVPARGVIAAQSVDPGDWGSSLCGVLGRYMSESRNSESQVKDLLSAGNAITETRTRTARDQVFFALQGTADSATQAARELAGFGEPAVTNGKKIAARFVATLRAAGVAFHIAAKSSSKAPIGNSEQFRTKMNQILAVLQKALEKADSGVTGIEKLDSSGQLAAAISEVPSCARVFGSGASDLPSEDTCLAEEQAIIAAEDAFHAASARYGTMSDLLAGELLPSPSTLFDAKPTADGLFYRLQSTKCVAFPGLLGG